MKHLLISIFNILLCIESALAKQIFSVDQGWTESERHAIYQTPQGVLIMPLHWFLNLESGSKASMLKDEVLDYGITLGDSNFQNQAPFGLPQGLTAESHEVTYKLYGEKLGLGITCSACHSQTILIGNKKLKIDGGSSQFDIQKFEQAIVKAVAKVLGENNTQAFDRFVKRLGGDTNHPTSMSLKQSLQTFLTQFSHWHNQNHRFFDPKSGKEIVYGPGRMDGLGGGTNDGACNLTDGLGDLNAQTQVDFPHNCRTSHPPTNIPHLWGMGKQEYVQWNGQVHQNKSIARDLGQATGSYGKNWIKSDATFDSSADPVNIYKLEKLYDLLTPPKWEDLENANLVPKFEISDIPKLKRGRSLYLNTCNSCHAIVPEQNKFGQWKIYVGALPEVKTDPGVLKTDVERKAWVPPFLREAFGIDSDQENIMASQYRAKFVGSVTLNKIKNAGLAPWVIEKGAQLKLDAPDQIVQGYKARSLEGIIWTAPFLHNGSVPSIEELLLPEKDRSKSFYVGCSKFDIVRMGYDCTQANGTLFDTKLYGNSNIGHSGPEYGTDFDKDDREALISFLKYLGPSPEGATHDQRVKKELQNWENFLERIKNR